MSIDQFTRGFEQYRADLAAADGGAPRLSRPFHHVVFFGPLTEERRAMVATIEEIVGFFEREYGLSATAATFVLDIDVSTYERLLGTIGFNYCGHEDGSLIYVLDACAFPFIIAHEFAHVLLNELGEHRAASRPQWLVEGAADYLALQQWLDDGPANPETAWPIRQEFAASVIKELPAAASDTEVAIAAIDGDEQYKVYILAVRHLVERFGIDALFAAFGPTWRDAGHDDASRFQAVVGTSLEDFYASFGRWLRSLPAPSSAAPDVPQVCPVARTTRGVDWIDLDALGPGCTVARDGGRVVVSRGDVARAFWLYGGWDWRVVDGTHLVPSYGVAAVRFETIPNYVGVSSGSIRFALSDGRELARRVPVDVPELRAIFDAITSSALAD